MVEKPKIFWCVRRYVNDERKKYLNHIFTQCKYNDVIELVFILCSLLMVDDNDDEDGDSLWNTNERSDGRFNGVSNPWSFSLSLFPIILSLPPAQCLATYDTLKTSAFFSFSLNARLIYFVINAINTFVIRLGVSHRYKWKWICTR